MTTRYTITGASTTRPTNLPDGFEVQEEKEVLLKKRVDSGKGDGWSLLIQATTYTRGLVFNPLSGDGSLEVSVSLTQEAVTALRDTLTEWLGDAPFVGRVWIDGDGDEWHEQSSGKFSIVHEGGGLDYGSNALEWITKIYPGGHFKVDAIARTR